MADLKLYRVSYSIEIPVLAESVEEAEEAVLFQNVSWTDDLEHGDAIATELTARNMPKEWANTLPWTEHDVEERTCGQILKEP